MLPGARAASAARAIAEDAARVTAGEVQHDTSVEELAPSQDDSQDENKAEAQRPADTARETDTREAMRLMIEIGSEGVKACRSNFSRV